TGLALFPTELEGQSVSYLQVCLGFLILLTLLFLTSENRKNIPWKMVAAGIGLQFLFGLLLLKVPVIGDLLASLNYLVQVIEKVTTDASSFMFGYLAGGRSPFDSVRPDAEFIVAFRVLPLILVISALSSLL